VINYFATGIYGMCASKAFLETKLVISSSQSVLEFI